MYDELIKSLRLCTSDKRGHGCASECAYGKKHPLNFWCMDYLLKEAADAIEDLITALTASNEVIAKNKPKWIPVTERLPETLDYVLCCGAKGGMFVGYIGSFTGSQDFAWAWQHGGKGRRIKWWMPLPQPPESEGK